MGDKDDIREGEEPGLDDVTSTLQDETPGADDPEKASEGMRDEGREFADKSAQMSQDRPA